MHTYFLYLNFFLRVNHRQVSLVTHMHPHDFLILVLNRHDQIVVTLWNVDFTDYHQMTCQEY